MWDKRPTEAELRSKKDRGMKSGHLQDNIGDKGKTGQSEWMMPPDKEE